MSSDAVFPRPDGAKLCKRPVVEASGHVVWRIGCAKGPYVFMYKIPADWFGTVLPTQEVFIDALWQYPSSDYSSWLSNAERFRQLLDAKKCEQYDRVTTGVPIIKHADATIESTCCLQT